MDHLQPLLKATTNEQIRNNMSKYGFLAAKVLKNHNFLAIATDIVILPHGMRIEMEIGLGCSIEKLLSLEPELIRYLSPPHDTLYIEAPIPWRASIGITIPWVHPYPTLPTKQKTGSQPKSELPPYKSGLSTIFFNNAYELCGSAYDRYDVPRVITPENDSISPYDPIQTQLFFQNVALKIHYQRYSLVIQKTLEAFGIAVKITSVTRLPKAFCMRIQCSTVDDIQNIDRHRIDIALACATPPEYIQTSTDFSQKTIDITLPDAYPYPHRIED